MSKPQLRDYQIADMAFYMKNPKCLNLSHAGTGKTPSVCAMQWFLWQHHQVKTAWVQPKRLLEKNRDELLRFSHFKPEDVVILDGGPVKIAAMLKSDAKVFLMSFRRFTLSWRDFPAAVKALHVDEFHKGFKNADSQACQALFNMNRNLDWFIAMTGTLISGKLTSAYPAIHVIEPRYYSSQYGFTSQHTIKDYEGNIIGWRNHHKLSQIFGKHAILRTFASIFGEQEVVWLREAVPMGTRQRQNYDKFHKDAILELDKFYIDGTQPGVAFIRARQLMEHPNNFPDLTGEGELIDIMPGEVPAKEELLEIHLEDHSNDGKPLIIYSAMRPQQQRIGALLEKYKLPFGVINGSMSLKQSSQVDMDFRQGKIQVVLCSPACADVGFNWQFSGEQEVDHIIYMTLDFLDTTVLQSLQRAIRGNRTTPLRVSVFEYQKSIDQHVMKIIHGKSVEANKVDPNRPIIQLSSENNEF